MKKIIIKPLVTEKATSLAQKNVYAFVVATSATKTQVMLAVTTTYNVTCDSVRMQVRKGKVQRVGRKMVPKKRSDKKIAYVHVTKGSIDLFPKA